MMEHYNVHTCFLICGILNLIGSVSLARNPDQFLNTPELIAKYGYPVENHTVTTTDGYILNMFRIPYSSKSPPSPNKSVVFLQHGLISSSVDWIILGPNKSLGYILADAGYDVWMGNSRGNMYSRKHTTLPTNSNKYWDFSWHEMGVYDLPAMIDYILNSTKQHDLYYVGMSMGGTSYFVLTSMKPEYNEKIRLMVGLAPAVFMANSSTPLKVLQLSNKPMLQFITSMRMKEVFPAGRFMNFVADKLCSQKIIKEVCSTVLFLICGFDAQQLNQSMLPVFLSHTPAGASWKCLVHYFQQMISAPGKFLQYDYGKLNMAKYKQRKPSEYNLKASIAPVSLFYGQNDPFADPTDMLKLNNTLPNVVEFHRVPWDTFNHLDFVWANDVKSLVYNEVITVMKRFGRY